MILCTMSNPQDQQYPTQSSKSPQSSKEPYPADNFQLDSGSSSTENLIESLSNSLALLTQSYKSHLSTNKQSLRMSSNARNNVCGSRRERCGSRCPGKIQCEIIKKTFQRNNARGKGHIAREVTNLLMRRVGYSPENDLSLNVDHVFEAEEVMPYDSYVDEGPITQPCSWQTHNMKITIYISRATYDSNTPFEVQGHDTFEDHMDEYHEVHEMQSDVQHNYVVDSVADYTSDSNIIPYDQYVEDNEEISCTTVMYHLVRKNAL
ncbi:hypothetical protein Tco_0653764 [Tanacetum coccineum]|uniref:Uncharacterized protein n=1 Tax=Tanacetum coccineum TaxID=301880 RepID=A0ABQ4X1H8_9ASTR